MDFGFLASLDFSVAWRFMPALLLGLWTNILLTAIGFLIGGLVLGTLFAIAGMAKSRLIRWPLVAFVEFWRSTPLLVQAIWVHFAVPVATGIPTTPFQSALIALIFNVSAYASEIIRAGVLGVGHGQFEAARALGLRPYAAWWKVILPQAVRLMMPPLIGTTLSVFKATAILSILAINDLMRTASRISSHTFQPVEVYTTAAVLAFAVGLLITWLGHLASRRLNRGFA
jgi:His/Glu/Gln/Arg/opine family amino acid ABC transporter permease subunit